MQKKRYAGIFAAALFSLLSAAFLIGCSKMGGEDVTGLRIDKNGAVTSSIVETFDKAYYAADGLETMIREEIAAYCGENSEQVTLQSVELLKVDAEQTGEVQPQKIAVTMKYASCEDYAAFNEAVLFYGTVAEAQAAGYQFDTTWVSASDAQMKLTAEEFSSLSDKKVLIAGEMLQVLLPAKVAYMTEGTELINNKCINIVNTDGLTYVIMK